MFIQIVISIFAFFALIKIIARFKKQELKNSELFIWVLFWLAVAALVWVPNSLTKLANIFGIGRGADLIFYASIVVLFYILFRIYLRLEKIERNITKIVKKNALDEMDKKYFF